MQKGLCISSHHLDCQSCQLRRRQTLGEHDYDCFLISKVFEEVGNAILVHFNGLENGFTTWKVM